ncbi:MAG: tetraacyldisaccharide 4'-kinase [Gammaproteobacteria bacterium]|nr:tetraacyldisaccharide 4'-kinase [Gammaproteobacteria bacterium]
MRIEDLWYEKNIVSILLLPIAWLFAVVVRLRRTYYRIRNRRHTSFPVPVIVVGNITVGGTGKTPLVIWLAKFLRNQGLTPGIVSRGYGGRSESWPQFVTDRSDPAMVGDEPVLIASHSACPVVVAPRRVKAALSLLSRYPCDVLISDDGLQHYALSRDIEVAVLDGERWLGNGYCLPAGPLREPPARLKEVDFVIVNGKASPGHHRRGNEFVMEIGIHRAVNLVSTGLVRDLEGFRGESVHALAGIGNPERFFNMLRERGLDIISHTFADHHHYIPADLQFAGEGPVLMTEKDAVKCKGFAGTNFWYLPVTARPDQDFADQLIARLKR